MWFKKIGIFPDSLTERQWNTLTRFLSNPRFGTDESYTEITQDGALIAPQLSVSDLNVAPDTSTSDGTKGEIRITDSYIYVCTATNTWKRTSLSTF